MASEVVPFSHLIEEIVDNRGRSCPTADSGIPLIATNCIRNDSLYPTYEKARFVSQETYTHWFRGHPKPGDILFVNKATPGRVCLVPDPIDFCIAQDMVAVRADPNKVYPRYLFAALRSPSVQEQIARMHVGTLIPHFKKGDFDKLLIPVPCEEEQHVIGDVYFNLSAKIHLNRQMGETLEAMARALFKSWFVDFDPVRAKAEGRGTGLPKLLADLFPARLVDSEFGEIPEGWAAGTLAEVSALNPEAWTKTTRPAEIKYVDLSNTKRGRIEAATAHSAADAPSRAQRVLRPGDTIVGTVRPGNGSYALVSENGLTGSTGFAVLRPSTPHNTQFVYLAATASENIDTLAHLADGGAYPAVRSEVVAATPVVRPDDEVLRRFSLAAGPLLAKLAHNEREASTLATLRNTLLPKLISGEVKVSAIQRLTHTACVPQ